MTTTLPVPWGTYGSTTVQYQLSKDGAVFTTSIGNLGGSQAWRGRVWRIPADGSKPEVVFQVPGACQLFVVNKQLLCVWIDTTDGGSYRAKIRVTQIEGYIPLDDAVSGDIVNINENQVALLNQRIDTALATAHSALVQAQKTANDVARLESSISALTKQVMALNNKILSKPQIEDIVWAKIWDVNFLIRAGFRQGSSTIREVQDYLVDLATYIRSVVGK